jgi:hypothetical protein
MWWLLVKVRIEVVLRHLLETYPIDLSAWIERNRIEENNLFGGFVTDSFTAENDQVAS